MSANKDKNGEIFRSFQICLRSFVEITWFTIQFSLAVLLMSTYSYLSCPHNLLELQFSLNDSGFCPYHTLHFFSSSEFSPLLGTAKHHAGITVKRHPLWKFVWTSRTYWRNTIFLSINSLNHDLNQLCFAIALQHCRQNTNWNYVTSNINR